MVSPALTKNQYSTTRVNRSCTPNSHIARLAQPKNKVEIKKKTATIPAVTIQSKTIEKVDEKTKKRELVKLKLGALVKGYKVRRIFSHNRQIAQLRHELIDLVKFIDILQKEIN
jgi:thiamine biosynthesis lipoprotein ApbE